MKKTEKGSSSLKFVTHNSLAETNGRKWQNTVIKTTCILSTGHFFERILEISPEITHFTVHSLNSQLYLMRGSCALSNLWINCVAVQRWLKSPSFTCTTHIISDKEPIYTSLGVVEDDSFYQALQRHGALLGKKGNPTITEKARNGKPEAIEIRILPI